MCDMHMDAAVQDTDSREGVLALPLSMANSEVPLNALTPGWFGVWGGGGKLSWEHGGASGQCTTLSEELCSVTKRRLGAGVRGDAAESHDGDTTGLETCADNT